MELNRIVIVGGNMFTENSLYQFTKGFEFYSLQVKFTPYTSMRFILWN